MTRASMCKLGKKHFLMYHNPMGPTAQRMHSLAKHSCAVTNLHNRTQKPCQQYKNKEHLVLLLRSSLGSSGKIGPQPIDSTSQRNREEGANTFVDTKGKKLSFLPSISSYKLACLRGYWLSVLDGLCRVKKIWLPSVSLIGANHSPRYRS